VGGGLAIANACDIRVAQAGARFGVPIARTLGNCLSPANLRRLTATLGQGLVTRMMLLAETLAPLGYLAAVAEADRLDAEVAAICERLLGHAPVTMRVTRAMLRRLELDPQAEATDLIAECYGSRDFAEGVEAFLAKRPAAWTGT
jgi:enoyl-CoA hydratase